MVLATMTPVMIISIKDSGNNNSSVNNLNEWAEKAFGFVILKGWDKARGIVEPNSCYMLLRTPAPFKFLHPIKVSLKDLNASLARVDCFASTKLILMR